MRAAACGGAVWGGQGGGALGRGVLVFGGGGEAGFLGECVVSSSFFCGVRNEVEQTMLPGCRFWGPYRWQLVVLSLGHSYGSVSFVSRLRFGSEGLDNLDLRGWQILLSVSGQVGIPFQVTFSSHRDGSLTSVSYNIIIETVGHNHADVPLIFQCARQNVTSGTNDLSPNKGSLPFFSQGHTGSLG